MPELHAKLSPSAAERWMNCPGSVALCVGIEGRTSEHAAEGTRAHKVAEMLLQGKPVKAEKDMLEHVTVYVRAVEELCEHPHAQCHIEKEVKVNDDCWGTADAIVWRPDQATLYVRDLKYGAGVGVEVSDNLQLKIYALAALLTMKYPAKQVNVGIVQPRYPHSDGACRSKDYDVVDLLDFYADLQLGVASVKAASIATEKGRTKTWQDTYLHPTEKGCRWCLAAPTCPKLKHQAQTVARQVFSAATTYDPKALADTLDLLPILEGWIKNCREFAYAEAEQGKTIPGYKLVPKQATRKWKADVADDLASQLGIPKADLFNEAPMKTITEVQKLVPGKNDKERAAVLEPFVTKESAGHTLVHESDKREAIRVDAKAAFLKG